MLCYVIDAELEPVRHAQLVDRSYGGTSHEDESWVDAAKHTLWQDPDHGYHLAKAVSVYSKPLGKGTFVLRQTRANVRFAQMDGVWLPVEMDGSATETGTTDPCKTLAHYKVTSFVRNPDHEVRGLFRTSDVADGALLWVIEKGKEDRRGRWQDGRVAP